MIDTFYILRHGFRQNWIDSDWTSATSTPRDPPLAAFGKDQAQEVANYFKSLPVEERPTAIFSSPYYRCIQTSKPIAHALGLPIFLEHGISEWYCPVTPGTGLHPRPSSATVLKAFFPEIDDSWTSLWYPSRKGENVLEIHARLAGFLEVFVPEVEHRMPTTHSRILLVAHAAPIAALTRELLGDRNLPLKVGCCTLTDVKRTTGAKILGGWTAKALASGDHLSKGVQRAWGFEDVEIADAKVADDPGVLGSEDEEEGLVGCQLQPGTLESHLSVKHIHYDYIPADTRSDNRSGQSEFNSIFDTRTACTCIKPVIEQFMGSSTSYFSWFVHKIRDLSHENDEDPNYVNMVNKIYIARHGFRKAWVLDHDASETGVPKDEALTEYGEAQSLELANHLSALPLDERPTAIFCSPYYRCLQTAKPISKELGLPVFVEHGLSEWRSTLFRTRLHHPHMLASTMQGYFPEVNDTWAPVWFPSRNGENIEQVHNRMAEFMEA